MERLKERIKIAEDALRTLDEILEEPIRDEIHRDAAIQRFEYSFEAVTKAVQRYLQIKEGLVVGSPKSVVRSSFQVGLIGEAETEHALLMVDDRNLTVHTYNRDLAVSLTSRLQGHARLLRTWLNAVREHI